MNGNVDLQDEHRIDPNERVEIEAWNITEAQETLAFENTLQIK